MISRAKSIGLLLVLVSGWVQGGQVATTSKTNNISNFNASTNTIAGGGWSYVWFTGTQVLPLGVSRFDGVNNCWGVGECPQPGEYLREVRSDGRIYSDYKAGAVYTVDAADAGLTVDIVGTWAPAGAVEWAGVIVQVLHIHDGSMTSILPGTNDANVTVLWQGEWGGSAGWGSDGNPNIADTFTFNLQNVSVAPGDDIVFALVWTNISGDGVARNMWWESKACLDARIYIDSYCMAYWSMNESSGTTTNDASGNNNNGALKSGAVFSTGYPGKAVNLDYLTKDYVLVPSSNSLVSTTNQLTIDAWIKLTGDTGTFQTVVSKWGNYYLRLTPQLLWFAIFDSAGSVREVASGFTFVPGTWYHLTGTYDGTTSRIYVDGQLLAGQIFNATLCTSATSSLHIGSAGWGVSETFYGLIDEVRLYDRATAVPQTQAPVFDPSGPAIAGTTTITISSATSGAKIYYTTDGNAPLSSGIERTNPTTVQVSEGTVLRAIAVGSDVSYETRQSFVAQSYPQARINLPTSTIHLGQSLAASGENSFAAAGNTITAYTWDYKDLNDSQMAYDWARQSNGAQYEHRPIYSGKYFLTLTVTDNLGNQSTTEKALINVLPNSPPQGVINYQIGANGTVQLDASQSSDPDNDTIVSWRWELPNGEVQYGQTINYNYAALSAFGVVLVVKDQWGLEGQKEADVFIDETPADVDATVSQEISITIDDTSISRVGTGSLTIPVRLGYNEYIPLTITNNSQNPEPIQVKVLRGQTEGGDNTWIKPQRMTINPSGVFEGIIELKTILNVDHDAELVIRSGTLECIVPITLTVTETYPIFGTQEHFHRFPPGQAQALIDMAYLDELPCQVYRLPDVLTWGIQQNVNNTLVYNFEQADWMVPNLINVGKTKVFPFLGYVPGWLWYLDENTDSKLYYWEEYVRTVAQRYTNISYWEPYNEPLWEGVRDWENNGSLLMFKLMRSFYQVIKTVNPNAKVFAPGWCLESDLNRVEAIINMGGDQYVDVYNFHNYNLVQTESLGPGLDYIVEHGLAMQMLELLQQYQIDKPLFVTESGGNAKCYTEQERRSKAIQWLRTNILLLDNGIKGILQYEFYDYHHDAHTPTFALMRHVDHYKLPMFTATREIIKSLTGAQCVASEGVMENNEVKYAVFERDNEQIVCVWSCLPYQYDMELVIPGDTVVNIEDKRFNYTGETFFDKTRINVEADENPFRYAIQLAPYQVRIVTMQKKVDSLALAVKGTLLGEWLMDDLTGGYAYDRSGNENDGSLTNGATQTTGYNGTAVLLDGVNDYVNVPASPSLISTTNQLTIDAWIKLSGDTGTLQTIVSKWNNYYLRCTLNLLHFAVFSSSGSERVTVSSYSFVPGTWYHIQGTYDGAYARLYVNDQLIGSQLLNITLNTADTHNLHIGSASWGVTETFKGSIDEVRIYDSVIGE